MARSGTLDDFIERHQTSFEANTHEVDDTGSRYAELRADVLERIANRIGGAPTPGSDFVDRLACEEVEEEIATVIGQLDGTSSRKTSG